MRFRAGIFLSLAILILAVGCRKPLAPNVDSNQAPETWITQAPLDTITYRNEDGTPVVDPPGTLPVRFHLYWAGADRDGEVAGFYWAVTETLPLPPPGLPLPPLPGPKPQDYRFTNKTDSTFIFNVSESRPDRQHAFFIYAVDNKGKADATPARFIFNALDRFPPDVVIYEAVGSGPIYRWDCTRQEVVSKDTVVVVRDSLTLGNLGKAPRDTVPARSNLIFRWRAEPTIIGSVVTGYRYKLEESGFISVPAESTTKIYPAGTIAPGTKIFTVRAVDQASGARETNRKFQMNISPDTWFAGPDPARFPLIGRDRYITPSNWSSASLRALPELQGTMLSSDSLTVLPSCRPERKTFFEIYRGRLYIRSEGDTVHMNSYVLFHGGGTDLDSPYAVKVNLNEPALDDTLQLPPGAVPRVVRPGGPNGSPIGTQATYSNEITPYSSIVSVPLGGLVPVFDPANVGRQPTVGTYIPMVRAGKVYFTLRSVDGNDGADHRVVEPRRTYQNDPDRRNLITVFYVNKPPYLLVNQTGFSPRPDTTFFTRTNLQFRLHATDDDPYNPAAPANPGEPSSVTILRYNVTLRGKTSAGRDTSFALPQTSTGNFLVSVPNFIVGPEVTADIELCDCSECEQQEGSGRCARYPIQFRVPVATAAAAANASRPGPDEEDNRRRP
jgi:hypothetical protein